MKLFAAIATVAPGTSRDRLGKLCSGAREKNTMQGSVSTGRREGDEGGQGDCKEERD